MLDDKAPANTASQENMSAPDRKTPANPSTDGRDVVNENPGGTATASTHPAVAAIRAVSPSTRPARNAPRLIDIDRNRESMPSCRSEKNPTAFTGRLKMAVASITAGVRRSR